MKNTSNSASRLRYLMIAAVLCSAAAAQAEDIAISMFEVNENGLGAERGKVIFSDSPYGLVITPELSGLPAGLHGFHVHTHPDCGPAEKDGKQVPALAAGGHFDPANAGKHGLPWGDGHLGDLPALYVDADGNATHPVLAPRLKTTDLRGHSLMVHAGGDDHSDHPKPLGGGGARIICGVIN